MKGIDIRAWDGEEMDLEREERESFRVEEKEENVRMRRENASSCYTGVW